jgi:dephospho-CoA kinase
MWKIYGLTGGIGSGKSTFARMLEEEGAVVIDADVVARDVVKTDSIGLERVVDAFGEEVLDDKGHLDREALGEIVFNDVDARRKLNSILHPLIAEESGRRMMEAAQGDKGPVFYEAALLVENEAHAQFAGLVVVTASEHTQIRRVVARDELTETQARSRIAAQLPLEEKEEVADFVIENDGSLDHLRQRARELIEVLREEEE